MHENNEIYTFPYFFVFVCMLTDLIKINVKKELQDLMFFEK